MIHKCSMRKSEFVALAAASALASGSFYVYEQEQAREQERRNASQSVQLVESVGDAPDFSAIRNSKDKKQAFFDYLKPGIALENQRVTKERLKLEELVGRFDQQALTQADQDYAQRLGQLYSIQLSQAGVTKGWIESMLRRVDVLPESLVLVQAANESAWGTSRFATQANNYFGQWCYRQGCGLVPLKRSEGHTHEVAKFDSVQRSIHGYFMNVNRNKAYNELREIRYQRHVNGESLTDTEAALALSRGLLKYSERGEAYVTDLQSMIRHNRSFWETPSQANSNE